MKKNKKIFLLFISFCIFFSCFKTLVKADEVLIQSNSALDVLNDWLTKLEICNEAYQNKDDNNKCALTTEYVKNNPYEDFVGDMDFGKEDYSEYFEKIKKLSIYLIESYFDSLIEYLKKVKGDGEVSFDSDDFTLTFNGDYSDSSNTSTTITNTTNCFLRIAFKCSTSECPYDDSISVEKTYNSKISFVNEFLYPTADLSLARSNYCSKNLNKKFDDGNVFKDYIEILEKDYRYTILKSFFESEILTDILSTMDIPNNFSVDKSSGRVIADIHSVFAYYYYNYLDGEPYFFPGQHAREHISDYGDFLDYYFKVLYNGLRSKLSEGNSDSSNNDGMGIGEILDDYIVVTEFKKTYSDGYVSEQLERVNKYLSALEAKDSSGSSVDIKGDKYKSFYYQDLYSIVSDSDEYSGFIAGCRNNYSDLDCLNVLEFGRNYTNFDYLSAFSAACNKENKEVWNAFRYKCGNKNIDIDDYCNDANYKYEPFCSFLRAYTVKDNVTNENCYKETIGGEVICSIRINNVDMSEPYIKEYPKEKPKFKDLLSNWFSKHEVNDADCVLLFDAEIKELINYILGYVRIIVPILVIVLGSVDLFKAVIANDEDRMKKAQKHFVKRLLFGLAVFLVPSLINILMWAIEQGLNVGNYGCQNIDLKL